MIKITTTYTADATVVARAVRLDDGSYPDAKGFFPNVNADDAIQFPMTEDPFVQGLYTWKPADGYAIPDGDYVFRFYFGESLTGKTQWLRIYEGGNMLSQNGVVKTYSSDM